MNNKQVKKQFKLYNNYLTGKNFSTKKQQEEMLEFLKDNIMANFFLFVMRLAQDGYDRKLINKCIDKMEFMSELSRRSLRESISQIKVRN